MTLNVKKWIVFGTGILTGGVSAPILDRLIKADQPKEKRGDILLTEDGENFYLVNVRERIVKDELKVKKE